MIQLIGLMIGMYIVVRMISFLTRKGERKESSIVQILAGMVIFIVIIFMFVLAMGPEKILGWNAQSLGDIFK